MTHLQLKTGQIVAIVAVTGLTVTLVLALQLVGGAASPGDATASRPAASSPVTTQPADATVTQPDTGSPVPAELPAYPPPGYPAEATPALGFPPPPTADPVDSTAGAATGVAIRTEMAAAMTEQAPWATPGAAIGPQVVRNRTGLFEITVPAGWRANADHSIFIFNYDSDALTSVHEYPHGGMKVSVQAGALTGGQSFEQWVESWVELTITGEDGTPKLVATKVEPYTLAHYEGLAFNYSGDGHYPGFEIILPIDDSQLLVIGLTPSDSPALDEAIEMLSTLVVMPESTISP